MSRRLLHFSKLSLIVGSLLWIGALGRASAVAQGRSAQENSTQGNAAKQNSASGTSEGRPFYVEVQETQIRREPKPWSPALDVVRYGEKMALSSRTEAAPGWVRVISPRGIEGVIHRSALTSRLVVLKGSESREGILSGDQEVVLAGKGFTSEVEDLFGRNNPGDSFNVVDGLEQRRVDENGLRQFVEGSGLNIQSTEFQEPARVKGEA